MARTLDRTWESGFLFQLLLWYARTAHDPDWGRQFIRYESSAVVVKVYHGQVIPGPLQTDDYTRALLALSGVKDVESALAERTERKRTLLARENPPFIWALMDESVLAFSVGGQQVMKDQLEHLREMADLANVIVRVVPTASGAHLGVDGPFLVLAMEDREVAYSGAQNG